MRSRTKCKPLADRVLVEPDAMQEATIGGILIPDTAKEQPQQGKIVAVGTGNKDEEMVLKKGDHVLFAKYAGMEIQLDNRTYLIMKQSDVFGVLEFKEKSESVVN